jgi:hypothetical protein
VDPFFWLPVKIYQSAHENPLPGEHDDFPDTPSALTQEKEDNVLLIFFSPHLLQVKEFSSSEGKTICSKQFPQLLHLYSYIGIGTSTFDIK